MSRSEVTADNTLHEVINYFILVKASEYTINAVNITIIYVLNNVLF